MDSAITTLDKKCERKRRPERTPKSLSLRSKRRDFVVGDDAMSVNIHGLHRLYCLVWL